MNRSEVIAQAVERLSESAKTDQPELAARIAKMRESGQAAVNIETVEAVVSVFFDLCTEALAQGEPVNVRRFGKFEPRLRRAMVKPNPKTGDPMIIPERLSATFLPSELLKKALNDDLEATQT